MSADLTFQERVGPWMLACFGEQISRDPVERNHRFLEEALELVQSLGCTASEAHQLVDYVYGGWLLAGWDVNKAAMRDFAFDGIQGSLEAQS